MNSFDELPRPDASGLPISWNIWGAEDQVGTLNNITPDATVAAARLIRGGKRYNLNLPLEEPLGRIAPGSHRLRRSPRKRLFKGEYEGLLVRDDKLEELYLQGSTQWDGLTHIGDPLLGFYNGVADEQITQERGTRNGIEHFVEYGIATRGVLVDLPRYFAATGEPWASVGSLSVSPEVLDQALGFFKVALQPGTALLVRTGWIEDFRNAATQEERERLFRGRDYSGLSGGVEMWKFLWDARICAVASDNVTVEVWPLTTGAPSLHLAIARLGLVLGEMFDLDSLAAACAVDGCYEFFFVSAPLNILGGVGSPANAIAIK